MENLCFITSLCFTLFCSILAYAFPPSNLDKQAIIEEQLYCAAQDQPCQSLHDRMAVYHVPGVSIAVLHKGELLWAKGYGVQDLQTKKRVSKKTLFQACSISKPVTALAVLDLVQQNKLSLDEDVNKILKGWQGTYYFFFRYRKGYHTKVT